MRKEDLKKVNVATIAKEHGTTSKTVRETLLKHVNQEFKRPTVLNKEIIKMAERIIKSYEM